MTHIPAEEPIDATKRTVIAGPARSNDEPSARMVRYRRLTWGAIDQAASSFTNLLVAIFVGRAVSPSEFGTFAAAMLAYQIANGLVRGVTSEPVVVSWSGRPRHESESVIADSLGAAVVLATIVGAAIAAIGLTGGGSFRSQMIVLGIALPGLQLQDSVRFVALTWRRSEVAAMIDLAWCAVMLAGGLIGAVVGPDDALLYLAIWCAGGIVTGPLGLLMLRIRPAVGGTQSYLRGHSTLAASYGFESVATRGAPRLATAGVGLLAGVREFAGLRGALLFGTQLAVLTQAVRLVAIPESVRGTTARHQARVAMQAMWVLTIITVIGSVVLLAVPEALGRQLLGETWALAQPLLFWVLVRQVFSAAAIGPEIALRAFANARLSFLSRMLNSVLVIVLGLGGAAADGARGAAIGMAIAQILSTVAWFVVYRVGVGAATEREQSSAQ